MVNCEYCIRTAEGKQSCCPFHYPTSTWAPFKVQAKQIAEAYNKLAEQEARPDLEED